MRLDEVGLNSPRSTFTICVPGRLRSVTIQVTLVVVAIKTFRHRGFERFFATGRKGGIHAKHADRLRLFLGRLNAATDPRDMSLPGLDLQALKGGRQGTWALKVSGNWRVTFGFDGKDVDRVDFRTTTEAEP
ncbi:MAG: type II toxin-antitoxin system RelE/ParE family toxin [Vicinamibacteria bacterium]|nr:type II toxin-antitoxin system RelE/ParE family toxin [Vicinamibacteria bacterium]